MFGTLGGPELILIFIVGLVVFGPRKLPDIGKSLGKMIGEFKRASADFQRTVEDEVETEKLRKELQQVKKVARELLNRLKALLVLNWRQKSTARSQLKLTIEDTLDTGLPRAYTPELYQHKCAAVFEHVYESYPERDAGIYA